MRTTVGLEATVAGAEICRQAAIVGEQYSRPSVVFRPRIFPDGNQWCALLGEDLQVGVAGFGDTPEKACAAFDLAWMNDRPPRTTEQDETEIQRKRDECIGRYGKKSDSG